MLAYWEGVEASDLAGCPRESPKIMLPGNGLMICPRWSICQSQGPPRLSCTESGCSITVIEDSTSRHAASKKRTRDDAEIIHMVEMARRQGSSCGDNAGAQTRSLTIEGLWLQADNGQVNKAKASSSIAYTTAIAVAGWNGTTWPCPSRKNSTVTQMASDQLRLHALAR